MKVSSLKTLRESLSRQTALEMKIKRVLEAARCFKGTRVGAAETVAVHEMPCMGNWATKEERGDEQFECLLLSRLPIAGTSK